MATAMKMPGQTEMNETPVDTSETQKEVHIPFKFKDSGELWSNCPICTALNLDAMKRDLDAAYGKVPLESFQKMQIALEDAKHWKAEPGVQPPLGQEIEVVADGETLTIKVTAACLHCDYRDVLEMKFDIHPDTF